MATQLVSRADLTAKLAEFSRYWWDPPHRHEFIVPVFALDFGFNEQAALVGFRCECGRLLER